jgi:hypothetical protein
MKEKDFIPYEIALELKQLGFDESCFGHYSNGEFVYSSHINNTMQRFRYAAPTYSQTFRWFREKFDWQHSIDPTADQHSHQLGYNYWIWNYKTGEEYHTEPKNRPRGDWEYETYEQTELACLKKLIELVKESNKSQEK